MEAVNIKGRPWLFAILAMAVVLVLAFVQPRAFAAGPTGKILGTVLDNSGAVIAGAKVTVTNEGTAETHVIETGSSGDFSFPVLPIGNYTLKVEKDGFQISEQKGIILQVDQNVSIPVTLQVGTQQQVVEVNGVNVGVDLADATVSHVVDQERIVNLPLDGRDTLQLQYVMPGVSYDNDGVAHGQGQHEGVVVNGNRPGSNYYLLDGVDMTDSYLSVAPVFPAPDALQEFDIQTSNFTAQYGRSSGGIVNAATKSGTNQWHGSLFEFFRNDVLNAHNFFDGQATPVLRKPSFKLNQFGGTIGGPIQHDKTFIFGYFQESRQRKDETYTIGTVLSAQERPDMTGGYANFTDLCTLALTNPNYHCPVDPTTHQPFPNNTIPAGRIDPTAVNFVKALMPLPNSNQFSYSFIAPAASTLDDDNQPQFAIRFDHTFGQKDQAFVRYFFNQDRATGLGFDNFPGALHYKNFRNQNVAIDWTHSFSPNFLNTAVFGFTRLAHTRGPSTSIGWNAFGGPASQNHPGVNSELYTSINGSLNGGGDGTFTQNRGTWQYTDYVSLVRGRHTMAIGGDFRKEAVNRVEDYYTDPLFDFNGQYTAVNSNTPGNALADLLLGLPNYYNEQTEVKSELRHSAVDLYIGDNFKVKPSFTIDAGLRWEPFLPPVDNLNDQVCFDTTLSKQSSYYPTAPPGLLFPGPPVGSGNLGKGDAGCPRQLIPTRWKNYAPRFGFNWDPSKKGKMSIRGSYGLFWDQARLIGYNRFSTSQPFDDSVIVNGAPSTGPNAFAPSLTGNSIYTNSGITNPYPFIIPRTPAQRAAFSPSFGGNWPTSSLEDFLAPNYNEGYSQEWNLTLEHQFLSDYTLTLSYIGNHGSKLWVAREYNYALPSSYDPSLSLTDNLNNLPNRRRYSNIQCGAGPCYGPLEEEDPAGYSHFNSVQVTLNRRMSHGLTFLTSYVFGRYLDIVSYGAEGGQGPRDPQNFALSYGPSDMDVRHRFVTSYIWQIPKMEKFSGISGAFINGWSVQGIADLQTGAPFSINSSVNTAANGVGGDTADLKPGTKISVSHKSIREYFNTDAFQNAAATTFGDTGRNFMYGPSLVNFDTSFFKQIPISERLGKMEFRAELFNTFNHANFNNPDNTVGDGTFGQILSARDPRFVQFALKWLF